MIVMTPHQAVPLSAYTYVPFLDNVNEAAAQAGVQIENPQTIDLMWRVFKSLPRSGRRFTQTKAAALRMQQRRLPSILPARADYTTTVDYYEAAMKLYVAQKRFGKTMDNSDMRASMRGVRQAMQSLVPEKLF